MSDSITREFDQGIIGTVGATTDNPTSVNGTITVEAPVSTVAIVPTEVRKIPAAVESALTELSFAARVLGNLSQAIELVVAHLDTEEAAVKTTVSVETEETTTATALSTREKRILVTLRKNSGEFVSKRTLSKLAANGRTIDLSSHISRIRSHGFNIESTQTARRNGEKLAKNLTGYRLTTSKQLLVRKATTQLRNIITDVFSGILDRA